MIGAPDGPGRDQFKQLGHRAHGVPGIEMRLIVDGASHGQAQFCAQLGLSKAVGAKGVFGVIIGEIGFTTCGGDPYSG